MTLNGIPISDDQCIGDSLQYINSAFQTLSSSSIVTAADTSTIDLTLTNRTLSASVIDGSITNSKLAFDGGSFCFRNKLINAQGLINQRVYVSGTATTGANQYTVDRWRVVTSGQNLTFVTANNITTFTAPAGGVEQVVEGLNVEPGTYVLSWTGTATATVDGTARANGSSFTLAGGANVTVKFSSGTFSLPQLERGTEPTPFEHRPIGTELALCQRYYETTYPLGRAPGSLFNPNFPQALDGVYSMRFSDSGNSQGMFWFIKYAVPKRIKPTTTSYATYTGTAGMTSSFESYLNYHAEHSVGFGDGAAGQGTLSTQYHLFANVNELPGISLNYYAQAHFVADAEL